MWTLRMLTAGAIRTATGPSGRLFPQEGQPWRIQLSDGSDPEGAESAGGKCWQSHQVPPRQSSWWRSRHGTQIMVPIVPPGPGGWFAPTWVHRGHERA